MEELRALLADPELAISLNNNKPAKDGRVGESMYYGVNVLSSPK